MLEMDGSPAAGSGTCFLGIALCRVINLVPTTLSLLYSLST
jgi:hypothetical protein